MMSAMTGVAACCRPICHGVGWPSPAKAALAPANRATTVTAIAVKRDNFIGLSSSLFLILATAASGSADYVHRRPQQYDLPARLARERVWSAGIGGMGESQLLKP